MENQQASFRDRPINIDDTGKRKWIFARKPKGKWYTRRSIVAWLFLGFLVLAPFIRVGGNPLMLLDIAHRKFVIFGQVFMPQDTYILALIMAVTVVGFVLFTVAFGRLWCGWACPQTLFLEHVFRRIEYLFDGDYRKGTPKPSTGFKKLAKHATFIITSIFFTNAFLNWFTGPERLYEIVTGSITANWAGFLIMLGISTFYYWIYAYFREQVCTMVCPYGRMQGVLIDSKTITVAYDYKRGEPRGPKAKGDCISCNRCVSVCPTGIDIKNGSQLECVNCTACIDECNQVMASIKRPLNLIRYTSVEGIEKGKTKLLNARTIAYSSVLAILFAVLVVVIAQKTDVDTTIQRLPGTMFQQIDATTYSNVYNLKIVNKTAKEKTLSLNILSPAGGVIDITGKQPIVPAHDNLESVVMVKLNKNVLSGKSTSLKIGIFEGDKLLETIETNFFGPTK